MRRDITIFPVPRIGDLNPIIVAVNDAGWTWRAPIDHWCSLHPQRFYEWQKKALSFRDPPKLWTTQVAMQGLELGKDVPQDIEIIDPPIWGKGSSGSSGLLGVQVALAFAKRVILCGIPLDGSGYVDGASGTVPQQFLSFRPAWEKLPPEVKARIRSQSGWTRDLLGAPTRRWILGEEE